MDEAPPGKEYSFGSSYKLRLKSEFDYVRNNGEKYISRLCVLSVATSRDGKLRGGVICGKKYSLKAVERNRARRLCWESIRMLRSNISPVHFVLIPRAKMKIGCKQQDVQRDIAFLFRKAGLLNGESGSTCPVFQS
ncbi:MAG: ribonuclease P protein component [Victivallaceae bacterium]|jgi:ribonuclease P protein component|nr:ribonuclease P protein component [Victivallaceae bacterium]MDD3117001.1 ribonuclease P protein component [Victivallaceae bacterium]MDD3703819.1 ribonuclease P protein component [Victivallaceae bacterium]MDD4317816.1 ribonuclease P protein component [Victivallaceae bacterium]MDD5663852.1 ribonuclease P protein component [Victivallaceae bacterium]